MANPVGRFGMIAMFMALMLMPGAWAEDGADSRPVTVTVVKLMEMLKTKDFFLVNVSPTYEGEVPGTDALIRYDETKARIWQYPSQKGSRIVVYCLTGRTSALALGQLRQAGFTSVSMLEGGLRAWEKAGYTVIRRNASPSIPYPSAAEDPSRVVPQPCPCGLN